MWIEHRLAGFRSRRLGIALEHSGYDLLNIGDTAMLKATVTRLQNRWPRARLQIITTSRERLAALSPVPTRSS